MPWIDETAHNVVIQNQCQRASFLQSLTYQTAQSWLHACTLPASPLLLLKSDCLFTQLASGKSPFSWLNLSCSSDNCSCNAHESFTSNTGVLLLSTRATAVCRRHECHSLSAERRRSMSPHQTFIKHSQQCSYANGQTMRLLSRPFS